MKILSLLKYFKHMQCIGGAYVTVVNDAYMLSNVNDDTVDDWIEGNMMWDKLESILLAALLLLLECLGDTPGATTEALKNHSLV